MFLLFICFPSYQNIFDNLNNNKSLDKHLKLKIAISNQFASKKYQEKDLEYLVTAIIEDFSLTTRKDKNFWNLYNNIIKSLQGCELCREINGQRFNKNFKNE